MSDQQPEDSETVAFSSDKDRPDPAMPVGSRPRQFPGNADPSSIPEEIRDLLQPGIESAELFRLDGYAIHSVLGIGGMGVVLAAWDYSLARPVAIKLMKPSIAASPVYRERFLREARTLASLMHENIVPIHHVQAPQQARQVPYLVMPLLPGETLETRLTRESVLSIPDLIQLAQQVARGLQVAHKAGIIHRDIKPANIWLEKLDQVEDDSPESFRVRLLDFGLARDQGDNSMTQSGAFLGTAAFSSPEQIDGQKLDARTDLFSLGIVLYKSATGKLPFNGDGLMKLMRSVCDDTPTPAEQLRPELPANFLLLLNRLLEKDREKRLSSAKELLRMLTATLSDLNLPAIPGPGSSKSFPHFQLADVPLQAVGNAPVDGDSSTPKLTSPAPLPAPQKKTVFGLPMLGCQVSIVITLTLLVGVMALLKWPELVGLGTNVAQTSPSNLATADSPSPPTPMAKTLPTGESVPSQKVSPPSSSPGTTRPSSSPATSRPVPVDTPLAPFSEWAAALEKLPLIPDAGNLRAWQKLGLGKFNQAAKLWALEKLSPAERQSQAAKLSKLGQFMLVYRVSFNSLPEMQTTNGLAAHHAEKLFELAYSAHNKPEFAAWQLLAKLMQPGVDLKTTEELRKKVTAAASPPDQLIKLLSDEVKARFTADNIPDLKEQILNLRNRHDEYAKLLGEKPTQETFLQRLMLQHALRNGIALLETDQSNYFRQEQLSQQLEAWSKLLNGSADELLLKAHYLETVCKVLKPYTRFDQAEGKPNYNTVRQLVNDANLLLDEQSLEAKLAHARAVYISTTDRTATSGQKTTSVAPSILAAITSLKESLAKATELPSPDLRCELHFWLGQLGMNAASTETDMQKAYDHVVASLKQFAECEALARLHPLGQRVEDAVYAQMKARELDVLIAYKFGDPGSISKIKGYHQALAEINKLSGYSRLKARGYLIGRELLAKQDNSRPSIADYRAAIQKLPSDLKSLTTSDAEERSRLAQELGMRILDQVRYNTNDDLNQAVRLISDACKEFNVGYELIDTHPFQNSRLKAYSAGLLGKWTRIKGMLSEEYKIPGDFIKTYQEAIEPLVFSLSYSSQIEDYWSWQGHLGFSLLTVAFVEIIPDYAPNRKERLLPQLKQTLIAFQMIQDAKNRETEAKENRSNQISTDARISQDLNTKQKQLVLVGQYLQKSTKVISDQLSNSEKLIADITMAEIDLIDPTLENADRGKALANKTLPDLKKLAADTKLTPYERYKYLRIIDRVESLLK